MNATKEKLEKALVKLAKVRSKVDRLRDKVQEECDHVYILSDSHTDDDGYSRRMCTRTDTYICTLCGHSYNNKTLYNPYN